jgi:hypothetical protein
MRKFTKDNYGIPKFALRRPRAGPFVSEQSSKRTDTILLLALY